VAATRSVVEPCCKEVKGEGAGPGGGPARAELAPSPHLVPAGPCRAGRDLKPGGEGKGVSFGPHQREGARDVPAAGGAACALAGAWSGVVMVEASPALASLVQALPSSRAPRRARELMGHNDGCSTKLIAVWPSRCKVDPRPLPIPSSPQPRFRRTCSLSRSSR
jgi:hypothetical protein